MKKEEVNKQIKEVVRPNGKGEINGNNLQETLLLMNNNAANDEDTTSKLNLKANQKETDEKLALKADKTSVYTKEEANALLDLKVNIKDYEADKEVSSKEKQELDVKLAQTKQELDSVKNSLSHMGNGAIGEAKGGSIINLPNNAMKSVVPNYRIEGLTVQNLVNGDFTDGKLTDDFEIFGGDTQLEQGKDHIIVKTNDDYGCFTSYGKIRIPKGVINEGDKIYIFSFAKQEKGGRCYLYISGVTSSDKKISNEWTLNSCIIEPGDQINYSVGIRTSKFKEGDDVETLYVKTFGVLNLTRMFGAGNEPSKEWCDEYLPDYVEGTKSVQLPMRVKSVGENVVDFKSIFENVSPENIVEEDGRYCVKIPSGVKKLIDLNGFGYGFTKLEYEGKSIPVRSNVRFQIAYKDGSKSDTIASNIPEWSKIQIEIDPKKEVDSLWSYYGNKGNGYFDLNSIMLSKTNNDYKPYQESLAYFNDEVELRSVTTTKDYIENGKLYKNIKRHYFSKEDEWTLRDDYTGDNFRYYMTLPFNYKATGDGVEGELFCNNFTPTSNVGGWLDERDSNTIALYRENDSILYLTLDKKVDNVNDVIPDGTFVDVILPQTEVINLNTSGLIEANPNGTVFFEPITNLTGFYDNGLDVEGLEILEVEEFSHLINGVYQSLDVSKVKIEGGKLTHPDAQNGIVYLVYRYDDNAVWGENTISYYNSDKTLKSPNGKIWKKVETATDTGELVVTLEEVNNVEP